MIKKIVMRWLYQTDTGGFLQTDFQFSGHIFIDLEAAAGAPGQDSADQDFLISLYTWFGATESVLAL